MGEKVMNAAGITDLGFPMWPQFNPDTLKDIQEPIINGKVNYWTGPKGMEFEEMFREWTGAKMAISCTNGTAALHIGISSLGIGPGDEVIVPSYTFIASSFAVVQAGAIPVFCDVTDDHTIDPAKIEALITPRTKGIVVVHLYGVVADMDPIMAIAKKHNLKVIEDCAQCIGGKFRDTYVGLVGDVGCYSFCQSKHFTTGGEGGMVITKDEDLGWECRSFRDHGYDVRTRMNMLALEEKLPYIHRRVGFNYRMTEIQSIIGINEMKRFDNWNLPRRKKYAAMYDAAFAGLKGIKKLPYNDEVRQNSYWWYPIIIDDEVLDIDAAAFVKALQAKNIPCYGIQWPEAYLESAYKDHIGFGTANFPFDSKEYTDPKSIEYDKAFAPNAHRLRSVTFSLFLHPSWEEKHIEACIAGVKAVIAEHTK
ncbi:MAG: DegT/DnrJ/EryC1/StrS family aminotransferase [Clostridiaceae bacterium]|nr:DegT/DnrJ/EryC1/StrS family aminotransferase [Clostridiales bacterium]MDD6877306.1 DegT/DnrJ/EryC1/StrS family aminotransferase [Clostridiaceae bacterium]MDY3287039.1 DegT/DnrJ/EryC1/StrS family aminotransferase [Eubacteriales bacterium]